MSNSESSQTMCIVVMAVRHHWGCSSWSADLHRGCFIKLMSGINEPLQKPPWHDIHENHWEAYRYVWCLSVCVVIVSNWHVCLPLFHPHCKITVDVRAQWLWQGSAGKEEANERVFSLLGYLNTDSRQTFSDSNYGGGDFWAATIAFTNRILQHVWFHFWFLLLSSLLEAI